MPHRERRHKRDIDLILNTDVGDSIQGHVGPNTKQVFETLQGTPFSQPKLKLSGYEFIMRDQFGNHYHKMRAVLFDGELYDVDQYIKPSMMMRHDGGFADFEDRYAKAKLRITEGLLRDLREQGAVTLGRTNLMIAREKKLTQAPVAIETQDLTHQANRLEDVIRAARQADGQKVQDDPAAPEGFKPLKAVRAGAEQEADKVIQFPGVGLTQAAEGSKGEACTPPNLPSPSTPPVISTVK